MRGSGYREVCLPVLGAWLTATSYIAPRTTTLCSNWDVPRCSCSCECGRPSVVTMPQQSPRCPIPDTDTIPTLITHHNTVQTRLQDRSLCMSFHGLKPGMNGQGHTMFPGSVRSSRRRAPRRVKLVAWSSLTFFSKQHCVNYFSQKHFEQQQLKKQFSVLRTRQGQTMLLTNPAILDFLVELKCQVSSCNRPAFRSSCQLLFDSKSCKQGLPARTRLGVDVKGWWGACDFGCVKSWQFPSTLTIANAGRKSAIMLVVMFVTANPVV
jgi:hypothetical protein